MPASAIATQPTDIALSVREMPERLRAFARGNGASVARLRVAPPSPSDLEQILALIRVRGGHDFSAYKRDTLLRRIERRVELHQLEGLAAYVRYLETHDEEIDALWRDWLIGVSGFFRDLPAFEALARKGVTPLIAARGAGARLRVWVPGCATGEEAYSIAILLSEAMEALGARQQLQMFATDLDPAAIESARIGRFPKSIADAVGKERLGRYFVEEDRSYRVRGKLRDRIVFAVQDVLHDPPFTRVDLISCRNLLIYLNSNAQQALLSVFHYSLNPGGLLLLGASEQTGPRVEHFSTLDKRWKLFRRIETVTAHLPVRWAPRATRGAGGVDPAPVLDERRKLELTETLRDFLAERFGPPAVVVDLQGQILETHGRLGPYLELPPGRPSLNVVDMARAGLRAPLVSALREIRSARVSLVEKAVRWRSAGKTQALRLSVARIDARRQQLPLLLVSFEQAPTRRLGGRAPKPLPAGRRPPPHAQLEADLEQMRSDLVVGVSELQAANEELASANEEVQSANEELQSSNEELQTSQEETQSLNEELQTVNAELIEKVRALAEANDDLENLMSNIEIATIFLDERLRVKRFTPQARSVARLIDTDLGRPLADLAMPAGYPDLLADAASVLATLLPTEKQAQAPGGLWYTVRIRPYRTARNAVDGLVITFVDVTQAKLAERTRAAHALAESIVDAVHEPLLVLDPTLRVVRANRSFYRAFRAQPAEIEGQPLEKLGDRQWDVSRLRGLLEATLREGIAFEEFAVVAEFPELGRRRMVLSGRPVMAGGERPVLLVLGIDDAGEVRDTAAQEDGVG